MIMKYKLLDFYSDLLKDVNIEEIEEGTMLSVKTAPDVSSPVNINGQRLCLPTKDYLRSGNLKDTIGFHPLAENIMYGESIVLKSLKSYIEYSVNERLSLLITDLVTIAADPASRKKLGSKGAGLFKALPNIDIKFADTVKKIIGKVGGSNENKFINIFLTHGGWQGIDGTRTAVVTMPVFDEDNSNGTVFGVKLRKADIAPWRNLMVLLLGDPEKAPKELSSGTFTKIAPFLHALLTSFNKLATLINGHVKRYSKQLENADDLTYSIDWEKGLDIFDQYVGDIPSLTGNTGGDEKQDPRVKTTWEEAAAEEETAEEIRSYGRDEPRRGRGHEDSSSNPLRDYLNRRGSGYRDDRDEPRRRRGRDYEDDYDDRRSSRRAPVRDDRRSSRPAPRGRSSSRRGLGI